MEEKAVFAAGCFWGVQKRFDKVPGVLSTKVGYTGGLKSFKNPTYEQVSSKKTKHVESIEIIFDNEKASYDKLLSVFLKAHDPTIISDMESQYRSAIFYVDGNQKEKALNFLSNSQKKFSNKILTSVKPLSVFFSAEEYHQKYYKKHKLLGMVC